MDETTKLQVRDRIISLKSQRDDARLALIRANKENKKLRDALCEKNDIISVLQREIIKYREQHCIDDTSNKTVLASTASTVSRAFPFKPSTSQQNDTMNDEQINIEHLQQANRNLQRVLDATARSVQQFQQDEEEEEVGGGGGGENASFSTDSLSSNSSDVSRNNLSSPVQKDDEEEKVSPPTLSSPFTSSPLSPEQKTVKAIRSNQTPPTNKCVAASAATILSTAASSRAHHRAAPRHKVKLREESPQPGRGRSTAEQEESTDSSCNGGYGDAGERAAASRCKPSKVPVTRKASLGLQRSEEEEEEEEMKEENKDDSAQHKAPGQRQQPGQQQGQQQGQKGPRPEPVLAALVVGEEEYGEVPAHKGPRPETVLAAGERPRKRVSFSEPEVSKTVRISSAAGGGRTATVGVVVDNAEGRLRRPSGKPPLPCRTESWRSHQHQQHQQQQHHQQHHQQLTKQQSKGRTTRAPPALSSMWPSIVAPVAVRIWETAADCMNTLSSRQGQQPSERGDSGDEGTAGTDCGRAAPADGSGGGSGMRPMLPRLPGLPGLPILPAEADTAAQSQQWKGASLLGPAKPTAAAGATRSGEGQQKRTAAAAAESAEVVARRTGARRAAQHAATGGSSSEKQGLTPSRIRDYQQRLVLLIHAAHCRHAPVDTHTGAACPGSGKSEYTRCPVSRYCATMKHLTKHLRVHQQHRHQLQHQHLRKNRHERRQPVSCDDADYDNDNDNDHTHSSQLGSSYKVHTDVDHVTCPCVYPHCESSRLILSHFATCRDDNCCICGPVHRALNGVSTAALWPYSKPSQA